LFGENILQIIKLVPESEESLSGQDLNPADVFSEVQAEVDPTGVSVSGDVNKLSLPVDVELLNNLVVAEAEKTRKMIKKILAGKKSDALRCQFLMKLHFGQKKFGQTFWTNF
jgi:hypothetical protein